MKYITIKNTAYAALCITSCMYGMEKEQELALLNQNKRTSALEISNRINAAYKEGSILNFPFIGYKLADDEDFSAMKTILNTTDLSPAECSELKKRNAYFRSFVSFYTDQAKNNLYRITSQQLPHLQSLNGYLLPNIQQQNIKDYIVNKVHRSVPMHYTVDTHYDNSIRWSNINHNTSIISTANNCIFLINLTTGKSTFLIKPDKPIQQTALSYGGKYTFVYIKDEFQKTGSLLTINNETGALVKERTDIPFGQNLMLKYIYNRPALELSADEKNTRFKFFTLYDLTPEETDTLGITSLPHKKNQLALQLATRNYDIWTGKYCLSVPRKSLPYFLLHIMIQNATQQQEFKAITGSPEYEGLYPIEQEKLTQQIKEKKQELNREAAFFREYIATRGGLIFK